MKIIAAGYCMVLMACLASAQTQPPEATVSQVNEGRVGGSYVSPRRLKALMAGTGPQNVNVENLFNLRIAQARQQPDIWVMGDDAINPRAPLIHALDTYLPRGGSSLGIEYGPYFQTWTAGTVNINVWGGAVEPFPSWTGFGASGGSITNQFSSGYGIETTDVTVFGWMMDNFTIITVKTQSLIAGVLGTAGVALTFTADNDSGTLVPFTTNVNFPAQPNLTASVSSSGTNMIYSIGQRNTGAGARYNLSQFAGGNFDMDNYMSTVLKSNTLRTFIGAWPPSLILMHDKNTSNALYRGSSRLKVMLTNAHYKTDLAVLTEIPSTNQVAVSEGEQQAVIKSALAYGFTALDTFGLFSPFYYDEHFPYYDRNPEADDGVHLSTLGNQAANAEVIRWLGLDYASVAPMYSLPKLKTTNLVTSIISHPQGTGAGAILQISNSVLIGFPGTAKQIADYSSVVPNPVTAGGQFIRTYAGNNNHGLGVGVLGGVTGGYFISDGSLLFGYVNGGSGTLRARFDVANNNNYFSGDVAATNGFIRPIGAVTLAADNQVVGATTNAMFFIASDNVTAGNRTFVLTTGVPGKTITLTWSGTNAGELVDDSANSGSGNVRLSATWTPTQYDSITLVGVGNDWYEISRSAN